MDHGPCPLLPSARLATSARNVAMTARAQRVIADHPAPPGTPSRRNQWRFGIRQARESSSVGHRLPELRTRDDNHPIGFERVNERVEELPDERLLGRLERTAGVVGRGLRRDFVGFEDLDEVAAERPERRVPYLRVRGDPLKWIGTVGIPRPGLDD